MAKLPRVTQKIFAQNSDTNDVTVFGTAKNGNNAVFTKDISQIMNSDAFSQGWGAATLTDNAPFQEDMNGIQLALSQQLKYLYENGIAEWDVGTTYYTNCFCQVNGVIYKSLTDNNLGNNPTTDETNWTPLELGGGRWGSISGNISEQTDLQQALTAKLNSDFSNSQKPYVTETYVNGTSGYRVWSDGYCIQWGYSGWTLNPSSTTSISLFKNFSNTDYYITIGTDRAATGSSQIEMASIYSKSTGSFVIGSQQYVASEAVAGCWLAMGYLALGQY